METKICNTCNKKLPKTTIYFFKRVIKQKLASGKEVTYNSFRSDCITCYGLKSMERKRVNRCEELGCIRKNYNDAWKKELSEICTKFPHLKDLPVAVRSTIRRWEKEEDYVFISYAQYKKDCSLKLSLRKRKYDHASDAKLIDPKIKSNTGRLYLTDAHIANVLGFQLEEVPAELIVLKRKQLLFYRSVHDGVKNKMPYPQNYHNHGN